MKVAIIAALVLGSANVYAMRYWNCNSWSKDGGRGQSRDISQGRARKDAIAQCKAGSLTKKCHVMCKRDEK